MSYARGTSVSVDKSETEIRGLLRRYGASQYVMGEAHDQVQIGFQMQDRRVVMRLRLPDRADKRFHQTPTRRTTRTATSALAAWDQACRERWRSLVLVLKAKLESVEAGIETFDQAFLAHIQLPSGETMGEWAARPEILKRITATGYPPMLPAPQGTK